MLASFLVIGAHASASALCAPYAQNVGPQFVVIAWDDPSGAVACEVAGAASYAVYVTPSGETEVRGRSPSPAAAGEGGAH